VLVTRHAGWDELTVNQPGDMSNLINEARQERNAFVACAVNSLVGTVVVSDTVKNTRSLL
jgi:hypothetical protein